MKEKKPTYNELLNRCSVAEIAADEMAYQIVTESERIKRLSIIQSICDFNVFFLYSLSPVILRDKSINFLYKNRLNFNRKIKIGEMMIYDTIIYNNDFKNFEDFKRFFICSTT